MPQIQSKVRKYFDFHNKCLKKKKVSATEGSIVQTHRIFRNLSSIIFAIKAKLKWETCRQ